MRLTKPKIALFAALLFLSLTLVLPPTREGAKLLVNDLFALSESANAYVYERLSVAPNASRLPACILLGAAAAAFAAFAALSPSRLPALTAALILAATQAYFGLSLPAPVNVLLFALPGLKLMSARSLQNRLFFSVSTLAVVLAVCLFFPGVNAATESASERMRDTLSGTIQPSDAGVDTPPEAAQTRRENHLSLSSGKGGAVSERDYRLITRAEEQISDPPWFDGLKTALMLLLIVLLLALPFVPFILLNRRAGQAQAIREAFDDADPRKAVCAMFRHVVRYWTVCAAVPKGMPFSGLPTAVAMPETYRKHYRACVDTFLKAAYGGKPILQAERDSVKSLLDETEFLLYDGQSAFRQLELRYRYLL